MHDDLFPRLKRTVPAISWCLLVLATLFVAAGLPQGAVLIFIVAGGAALVLLGFGGMHRRIEGDQREIRHVIATMPVPLALTDLKGRLVFKTSAFSSAMSLQGQQPDLRTLGENDAATAQAIYRLFAAARSGRSHREKVLLTEAGSAALAVRPWRHSSGSKPLILWQLTTDALPAEETSPGVRSEQMSRPVLPPQVSRSKDDASQRSAFANLFGHAPFGVATVGGKETFVEMNDAFQRLIPVFSGKSSSSWATVENAFVDDVDLSRFRTSLRRLGTGRDARESVQCEAISRLNGARIRLTAAAGPEAGQVLLFAAEPAAAPLDEQAVQNQKLQAVGELAGGIAHDFNNLLTAIIGFSDLLLTRFRHSDPAFKDVMNIKNNANRAAELVRQILAYSRRQTLRPALVTLTDVIEDFYASVGRLLGEKVRAKIEHGRDLWFVKADESQLFQVIMNLAVNARDAMPSGGELTIRTANVASREAAALYDRGLAPGEYVLVEVRDTGCGIAPETLKKIFDPFFSTKEVGKGTGLGLSTVYGIVKQTGGSILVDSRIGIGTSFRIYLPRHVETEEELQALAAKGEAKQVSADLTGHGTVLLVEDEEAVRSFASRALTTRGYTVLEAASGVEALEVMDREGAKIDLVVSDVVMPEMDGPTLLRHLRQRQPNIKIVFMSGYAEEAFRKNLEGGETFTFLPKPFTLKSLAETVKAAAA